MVTRMAWLVIGLAAVGLGFVGIFLPLLPTTPFILLAAYSFAQSSPYLHRWIATHPRFGPAIHAWHVHGAISRKAKVLAVAAMVVSLVLAIAFGVSAPIVLVQSLVLAAAAVFIVTRPTANTDRN